MSNKVYQFLNYKKEKCDLCGQEHVCTDVFGTKICSNCNKEFSMYRNIVNNILRKEQPSANTVTSNKENQGTRQCAPVNLYK
jgi:hypothetical protein